MTTDTTTGNPIDNLDEVLRDPLSLTDDALAALVGGQDATPGAADQSTADDAAATAAGAKPQGDTSGAAPSTDEGGKQQGATAAAAPQEGEAVVLARDGKNVIPYQVLQQERERAIRAEQMVRDLTTKLEQDQAAAQQGKATKSLDLDQIVDEQLLEQLREEAPDVARRMDNLIDLAKSLSEQVDAGRPAAEEAEAARREQQVQALVTVEDTIVSIPKLAHLRTTAPAEFNEVAAIDAMLRAKPAWQDKPLAERFGAALRMYEAEHGAIELPDPATAAAGKQPADPAARVAEAVAKAKAEASGPSTLSDIPGGQPAATSEADAIAALSGSALTDRFMNMSPDEIEAQLARLSS
ncbi:hypothetical protein U2261_19010 [Achromobacter xylosoxidans]|uniref:hypothetical protein n=1 Tax=Alcaligenes xylosoxydans xylosoxydans TaxID=85698 RepID=UPI002ACA0708|nr:hypothetical protein [Achromobacter xylosoxidans]MDZ5616713.1 hypothetical protein [Achromobacter xylosoxidans]MDZ5626115.1 hypothetical protein [Achromobacter xylosoxidans]MDZ5686873.1 hypothetical protein [Achromobacter xylosoxidans]